MAFYFFLLFIILNGIRGKELSSFGSSISILIAGLMGLLPSLRMKNTLYEKKLSARYYGNFSNELPSF